MKSLSLGTRPLKSILLLLAFSAVPQLAMATPTRTLYLKSSNTALGSGDFFGQAVAISGDTVVIGASGDNSTSTGVNSVANDNALKAGAAYVFVRSGNTWVQQAYLKASNTAAGDRFGASVAISGNTIIIGAPEKAGSSGAAKVGAAYVFIRNGSTWTQQAVLTSSAPLAFSQYGRAVAISGETIAVGQDGTYPSDPNFADVYLRNGTNWGIQTTLTSPIMGENGFGGALAIAGETIVVGAQYENGPTVSGFTPPGEGAAYVFTRSGTSWSQQARLKASNVGARDGFGNAVAISADSIVVGAYSENGGTTGVNSVPNENALDSGAAYVFARNGVTWSEQAYLKASNTGASDEFGRSVAISSDRIIVGAPREDSATTGINPAQNESTQDAGAAYIFTRTGAAWSQQAFLKSSNRNQGNLFGGDLFGNGVAVSDDTILVGANGEDGSGSGVNPAPSTSLVESSGAAYFFDNLPALVTVPEISVSLNGGGSLLDGSGTVISPKVKLKKSATKSFTLENTGTAPLNISSISKNGPHAAEFSIKNFTAQSLAPSAKMTFNVTFKPKAKGKRKAAIHIKSDDADEATFDIHVSGTAVKK